MYSTSRMIYSRIGSLFAHSYTSNIVIIIVIYSSEKNEYYYSCGDGFNHRIKKQTIHKRVRSREPNCGQQNKIEVLSKQRALLFI